MPNLLAFLLASVLLLILGTILGFILLAVYDMGIQPLAPFLPEIPDAALIIVPLMMLALLLWLVVVRGRDRPGRRRGLTWMLFGRPPRHYLLTDRRAVVVEQSLGRPRVIDEAWLASMPQWTRHQHSRRVDLIWDVQFAPAVDDKSMSSSRRVVSHGFLGLKEFPLLVEEWVVGWAATDEPDAMMSGDHQEAGDDAVFQALGSVLLPGEQVWWSAVAGPEPRSDMQGGVYAVTSLRAVIVQRRRNGDLLVNAFPPRVVNDVQVSEGPLGATFTFSQELQPRTRFPLDQRIFDGVRDVAGAQRALRRLTRDCG